MTAPAPAPKRRRRALRRALEWLIGLAALSVLAAGVGVVSGGLDLPGVTAEALAWAGNSQLDWVGDLQLDWTADSGEDTAAQDHTEPDPEDEQGTLGVGEPAPVPAGYRTVELPTHELEHLPRTLRVGVLGGDAGLDGGCLWVEVDTEAQPVRWPQGSEALFAEDDDDYALRDGTGQVVAGAGDEIYFSGATSGAPEELDRCHVGEGAVWYIGEVTTDAPFDD